MRPGKNIICGSPNPVIEIHAANYGRMSSEYCQFGDYTSMTSCYRNVTSLIQDLCQYRSECFVEVDKKSFLDSCPGILKYIQFNYTCTHR